MSIGLLSRIGPLLNKILPVNLAAKALGKVDPRLTSFFSNAAAAGFGADKAIEWLRNKFESEGQKGARSELENAEGKPNMRPDESAMLQDVRHSEGTQNLLQKGAALGAGALGGLGGLGAGALALGLNQAIEPSEVQQTQRQLEGPPDKKLLSGSPEPKQIQKQQNWVTLPEEPQPAQTQQEVRPSFDPLAALQRFPELMKFVKDEASKGEDASSIAAKARSHRKISQMIKAIEEDITEPFESFLARLIGQRSDESPQSTSTQKAQSFTEKVKNQRQGSNASDAALLAAFDKILKM